MDTWVEESDLYKCVHCGFCLQACPTYLATGLETESPRGRIALMKAVNEDRLPFDSGVERHWDLCIQCRACEVACPSGVPYGHLIEATQNQFKSKENLNFIKKLAYEIVFRKIVTRPKLLRGVFSLLRIYQISGLQKVIRRSKVINLISKKLSRLEVKTPFIHGKPLVAENQTFKAVEGNTKKIFMLSGCVMPLTHGNQMRSAIKVLNVNGFDVQIPEDQVCCGAINSHVGDLETARVLARKNIDAFQSENECEIVNMSGGCGARLKEYPELLEEDEEYSDKAKTFASRVRDIHELLVESDWECGDSFIDKTVTYQDSCHLANVQGIKDQPREILKCLDGVEFRELPSANICCGAGGTYMISEDDMSSKVLEMKLENVVSTGAKVIATANPGCYIQFENGIRESGLELEVKYVTDLLSESYESKKEKEL